MRKSQSFFLTGMIGLFIFYMIASGCATVHLTNPPAPDISRQLKLSSFRPVEKIHLAFKNCGGNLDFEGMVVPALKAAGYDLVDDERLADLDIKVNYQKKEGSRIQFTLLFFIIPVPGAFDLDHLLNGSGEDTWSFYIADVSFKTDSGRRKKRYLHWDPKLIANEMVRDIEKIKIQPPRKGENP